MQAALLQWLGLWVEGASARGPRAAGDKAAGRGLSLLCPRPGEWLQSLWCPLWGTVCLQQALLCKVVLPQQSTGGLGRGGSGAGAAGGHGDTRLWVRSVRAGALGKRCICLSLSAV